MTKSTCADNKFYPFADEENLMDLAKSLDTSRPQTLLQAALGTVAKWHPENLERGEGCCWACQWSLSGWEHCRFPGGADCFMIVEGKACAWRGHPFRERNWDGVFRLALNAYEQEIIEETKNEDTSN